MIVGAVVVAAGKSKRMGQNKLMLQLNGKPLIKSILDALSESRINELVLVLGDKPEQVMEALKSKSKRINVTINENYQLGMTSSFQTGLQLITRVDAAFLVLGDEPIFEPDFLTTIIQKMKLNQGRALIVSPIHKGKKGHPLLFHHQLFPEILNLKPPQTMREIVHMHANSLLTVEAPKWTNMDIDTPEDYSRLSDLIKTGHHLL